MMKYYHSSCQPLQIFLVSINSNYGQMEFKWILYLHVHVHVHVNIDLLSLIPHLHVEYPRFKPTMNLKAEDRNSNK